MTTIQETKSVLDMDAAELKAELDSGRITSKKITEAFIEQCKATNTAVNFLVEERFAQALKEADWADEQRKSGNAQGKLFGVPISMKESFDVAGMQTTGGLPHRKDRVSEDDAEIVRLLKAEGAIIIGKTNTPALCFCQETENALYGRTNNPRDLAKTVGGSSGGEGAAIALGAAAAGIGSDIGGSIRIPSHFNGIIGFKSGNRQVSSCGSYPAEEHPLQQRMLGIGPMTKSVRDAKFIYEIIANKPLVKNKLEEFTLTFLGKTNLPLSKQTEGFLQTVQGFLSDDQSVAEGIPPYFHETALLWQEIMSIDGAHGAAKEAFGHRSVQPVREYLMDKAGKRTELHRYLSWALIGASLFKPSAERVKEIEAMIAEGDVQLARYLDKRILILPVYHSAAPAHGIVYKELFSIRKTYARYILYVAYANVWGLPALTVPVGADAEGMPIAVQLVSSIGNEDALFELGKKLEKAFTGYSRVIPSFI
ncbi:MULTISPECIES: amidase [unclassified Sporosarcina]|uniref:amidase n=1 Tax=unclassified Sporosarcina TaxID=2647733 RepID=UPI002042575D|nr:MULTISPECIES: amidase [unclassified Sporosarcina]GKV66921.1 amidase [Sporosarcina sp. NCCP-2331]GLB57216.1 amidase [Sporosarcina sp. NCCP-2378]